MGDAKYVSPPDRKYRIVVEMEVEAPFAHEAERIARWRLDYRGIANARVKASATKLVP
jgi:hypothetical protein